MTKKNTKKQLILNVSSSVFANAGYNNAKISDIAHKAGIATGTVYLYFENKEHILKELLVEYWTSVYQEIKHAAKNNNLSARDKISESIKKIIERALHFPEIARMIVKEFTFWSDQDLDKLKKIIEDTKLLIAQIVQEGKNKEEFHPDLIPSVAVAYIIGGVWHLIEFAILDKDKFTLEVLEQQIQIIIGNSFSN